MVQKPELDNFDLEVTAKPTPGVVMVEIPEKLAKLLATKTPEVLGNPDKEIVLRAGTEAIAKQLALYAKAWGARQEPKLYIHKLPNGKQYDGTVARLAVELDEDVPPESRPGRRK